MKDGGLHRGKAVGISAKPLTNLSPALSNDLFCYKKLFYTHLLDGTGGLFTGYPGRAERVFPRNTVTTKKMKSASWWTQTRHLQSEN